MARYRFSRSFKKPSMIFSGGPRKPRQQQWFTGKKPGARFTCGLCHQKFTLRSNLNRHKRKCFSDEARFNGLIKEGQIRANRNPR